MDTIWHDNEALFRRLYLEERRTLAQVKHTVEREPHLFPEHPLSIYEARLRDLLHLRKKLKKEDWGSIHYHAVAQGLAPGSYGVILNGARFRPHKVWKEIRRNGYHTQRHPSSQVLLPPGVHIEPRPLTTSAVTAEAVTIPTQTQDAGVIISHNENLSHQSCALQTWDSFLDALDTIDSFPSFPEDVTEAMEQSIQTSKLCSKSSMIAKIQEALPWNQFRTAVLEIMFRRNVTYEMLDFSGFTYRYMPNDGFFPMDPARLLFGFRDTIYPSAHYITLEHTLLKSIASDRLIWYRELTRLGYIITDQHTGDYVEDFRTFVAFGSLLRQSSPEFVVEVLKSTSCTQLMRAVWDAFISRMLEICHLPMTVWYQRDEELGGGRLRQALAEIMIIVLRSHPEWVQDELDKILMLSAWLRNMELLHKLLQRGATASFNYFTGFQTCSTISFAADAGLMKAIQRLVDTIDVNASTSLRDQDSHLAIFLRWCFLRGRNPTLDKGSDLFSTLIILLKSGANVDALCPLRHEYGWNKEIWGLHEKWPLSCLEMARYSSPRAYDAMAPYSERVHASITRIGVWDAASEGSMVLDRYLASETQPSGCQEQTISELVLLDQLVLCMQPSRRYLLDSIRAKVVRVLLQRGAGLRLFEMHPQAEKTLIRIWSDSVEEYALTDDLRAIMNFVSVELMLDDFEGISKRWRAADLCFLTILRERNILTRRQAKKHAHLFLLSAARQNDRDALRWLLEMGADIDEENEDHESLIARSLETGVSTDTCRHLFHLGAKLRLSARDQTCARLLALALRGPFHYSRTETGGILEVWDLFNEYSEEIALISPDQWREVAWQANWPYAWEDERLAQLSRALLAKTAEPNGSPPLILAIKFRQYCLVQALLATAVDVDEVYENTTSLHVAIDQRDFKLARQLIKRGADVNIISHHASCLNMSALSRACSARCLESSSERQSRLNIFRFLIERGADVNRGCLQRLPQPWSPSPLYRCAQDGGLQEAILLLENNADPNSVYLFKGYSESTLSQHKHCIQTPLDIAILRRRFNMTQLLLGCGGLSAVPGQTGYDGAIDEAVRSGRHAFAELLREHIRTLRTNADSWAAHQAKVAELQAHVESIMTTAMEEVQDEPN